MSRLKCHITYLLKSYVTILISTGQNRVNCQTQLHALRLRPSPRIHAANHQIS